jgi:DNA-directed RNA polymerase specialized sigma24 family protein
MTRQPNLCASTVRADTEAYAVALLREAARLLARRRRAVTSADDVAATIVAAFLPKAATIMARHPDPAAFARLAVRRAGIAHDRRERAQRGEGVRLVRGADGQVTPRRVVLSGDAVLGEGQLSLFDLLPATDECPADLVVRGLDSATELALVLDGVAASDRRLLLLVDGAGYTVTEVADLVGQRRETVSRRLGRVRRQVQRNRAVMASCAAG